MLIGLTGAIGGGKSTALKAFAAAGADTCDADKMCHVLYENPVLVEQLCRRWGDVSDGSGGADRRKIAGIVFGRPSELEYLTGLLYPELERQFAVIRCRAAQPGEKIMVAEIPLLFENHWEKHCDGTAALWTGRGLRHARLRERGMSPAEIAAREARQWSEDAKLEAADYAVINSSSPDFLAMQCNQLLIFWKDGK